MDRDELREILDRPAREERSGQIRRLRLRLGEAKALDPNQTDSPELQSLEIGILNALADAFGFGTAAYRQFSAAGEFGVDHASSIIDLGAVKNAKRRAVALLRRAVQTKEEEFEDKFPGHTYRKEVDIAASTSSGADPEAVAGTLDADRLGNFLLDGGPAPQEPQNNTASGPARDAGDPRIAMAGLGQAGAMIAGFAGDRDAGPTGVNVRVNENALFGSAEASPSMAYDLLQARIAVLEAALSAPKPLIGKPIGPGHNGPPDFDPPMSEDEIQALVDVFRGQPASPNADLPKLAEVAKSAEVKAGQFQKRVDDFTDAVIKGAGGELGKKLVQIPWWTAVYAALLGVLDAAAAWILSIPM